MAFSTASLTKLSLDSFTLPFSLFSPVAYKLSKEMTSVKPGMSDLTEFALESFEDSPDSHSHL